MAEGIDEAVRQAATADSGDQGVSLLDLLVVLAKHKKLVLGLPLAAAIAAVVVSLLMPNWYMATAKILPPQQSQSNAVAILGQLGALAGGAGQYLGLKNPSDIYIAMLKSRSVADSIIERFELMRIYDSKYLVDARKELAGNSSIAVSRDGVITLEVEDKDPKRAADMANAYVEVLRGLTVTLAVSEAGQRRLFFEGQLKRAKNDLISAEAELMKFTQESGLVNPQGQIGLSVAAAAALRAQIAAKEIQLYAMRSFATESNPDLKRAQQELSGLQTELAKMERNATSGKGDVMVPFGKAPSIGLEYVRRFRDMKYYETLFEVLAKQYEIARIDEAKDATLIQVLDKAVEPERKSRPKRALIVILAALAAGFLAVLLAFIREAAEKARGDPKRGQQIAVLRRYLLGK